MPTQYRVRYEMLPGAVVSNFFPTEKKAAEHAAELRRMGHGKITVLPVPSQGQPSREAFEIEPANA